MMPGSSGIRSAKVCYIGGKTMFARLKFWLMDQRKKNCRSCCLFCQHYPYCSGEYFARMDSYPWK